MAKLTRRGDPPGLPLSAVTRAEALANGVTEWQWRNARLERPFHGVRVQRGDVAAAGVLLPMHPAQAWRNAHLELVRAYCCIMKPGQFFAGVTAALVWVLPIPINPRRPHCLELAVAAPAAAPRRAGVRGIQIAPRLMGTTTQQGFATIDAPTIWALLGPRLALADRVALGDAIIRTPRIGGDLGPRPRPAHARLEELVEVSTHRGRTGKVELQEALPLLRTGSASAPESHLRLAVVEAGLPEPALDADVYDDTGEYLGATECVYRAFKVALEYEGDHHRTAPKQWNRDIDKYADYEAAGWVVIRITAEKLYRHRTSLMSHIRRTLCDRGWRG